LGDWCQRPDDWLIGGLVDQVSRWPPTLRELQAVESAIDIPIKAVEL